MLPAEPALLTAVQESLALFQFDNAKFLGERLVALNNSEDNQQLLATCYMHCNQSYRAYHLLKGHNSRRSRYLLAVCCLSMNRFPEAKDALLKMGEAEIPYGPAGLYLLGKVCRLTNCMSEAKDYYFRALRGNPLLWSAYEELCAVGGDEEAAEVCSLAQLPPRAAGADGPSPSTSSQVSSAMAGQQHTPHAGASAAQQAQQGAQQGHGQQGGGHRQGGGGGQGQGGGHGHGRGGGGKGPAADPHRTPAQQHQPGGPAGTSAPGGGGGQWGGRGGAGAPPSTGGGFGFTGFGAAGGGGMGAAAAGSGALPTFGFGAGGGGGSLLFQTPVQGQGGGGGGGGGLFGASPLPAFGAGGGGGVSTGAGGLGWGFGFGVLPTGNVPVSALPVGGGGGGGLDGDGTAPSASVEGDAPTRGAQLFRFTGAGGGGGGMFATPTPAGAGPPPPGPPHKHQPYGQSEVPFPGFYAVPQHPSGAAAAAAGGHGGGGGAGAGSGPQRLNRMADEGRVRKVSNRLFSDPRSTVRRSERLAMLNNAGGGGSGGGGGGAGGGSGGRGAQGTAGGSTPGVGGAGGMPQGHPGVGGGAYAGGPATSASVLGQAKSGQASYVEGDSQNMPDPRDPPPAPVQQQLHPDAKLGAPAASPPQLLGAFGGRLGQGQQPQAYGVGDPSNQAFNWNHSNHPHQPPPYGGAASAAAAAAQRAAEAALSESRSALLQLLAPLMEGLRHLAAYRTADAITALTRAALGQYRTAWVMCALGRAHFEAMNYPRAAQSFEQARHLDRCRVEGMELYSTVLWHTKREYELSHLAQECVGTDRMAPQTWCVMGNLFSGQKEHEAAIEFFLRAAQVDPTFTYAYTLAGHEHYANEDYDKAAACYRAALKLDPRHYNAMYGLGQIAYRQEKYLEALQDFRMAAGINPRSSVLRCYVGMSAAKLGQNIMALDKLQEAIELDPANPLARYERSAVLTTLERPQEALCELEALQRVAPGEASVAFQMGKLHKRLNNLTAAQASFELALSYAGCSSSDAATIKAAIERLGLSDDEDEQEL